MNRIQFVKDVRDRLNAVSPSFCTMKWLHQTLYLHTGDNHSCYHPRPHHIGLDEIAVDVSALHNTKWKKEQRKKMLEGERPQECYYCWNIEDLDGDHISDRMLHSSSTFSEPIIEKIAELPWDAPINPRYLEISFGNGCNYRCGYCGPQASSMWMEEIKKHGNYDLTYNQYGIEFLKTGTYYAPKEENPYIEAFWKWWPSLKNDLHTLRITGGEPLMNPGAMQFFKLLENEPAPNLEVSINSNLGVTFEKVDSLYTRVNSLITQKKIKSFSLFTSIDSWGPQAECMDSNLEFIKDNQDYFTGIEYEKFKRVTDYMRENPVSKEKIRQGRRDFYSFFTENDRRLGTNLLEVFPEYTDFYNLCKTIYDETKINN